MKLFTSLRAKISVMLSMLAAVGIAPLYADGDSGYVRDTVSEKYTICEGQSVEWHGMTLRYSGTNIIEDTLAAPAGEADTIRVYVGRIIVSASPMREFIGDSSFCAGGSTTLTAEFAADYNSIVWQGPMVTGVADESVTLYAGGNYSLTIEDTNGCTHVERVTVTMHQTIRTDTSVAICEGEQYYIGDEAHDTAGTYTATYSSAVGCDSIVTIHLDVLPLPQIVIAGIHPFCDDDTLCIAATGAERYEWNTGETSHILCIVEGGEYDLKAYDGNGCMTQRHFSIATFDSKTRHRYDTICDGDMRVFHGRELTQEGIFKHNDTTMYGCDSSEILHLHINPLLTGEISINASDSLFWGGAWRTLSGTYASQTTGSNGCDSITMMHLLLVYGAPVPKLVLFDDRLITFDHYLPYGDDNQWHGYIAYRWYRNGNLLRTAHSDFYHNADYSPLQGCYHAEIALNEEKSLWMTTDTICVNMVDIEQVEQQQPTISPNPVHKGERITANGIDCQQMTLISSDGRTIATSEGSSLQVPATAAAGVCLLRLGDRSGKYYDAKIVILAR